jgi:hypothetical protein
VSRIGGDEHSFTDGELRLWLLIHEPSLQPIDYEWFAYTHCIFNTLAGLSEVIENKQVKWLCKSSVLNTLV